MKTNTSITFFLLLLFLSFGFDGTSQTEPRLILPIGHTNELTSAVFSQDGKHAVTASRDNTARIYEVATGKEVQVLSGPANSSNSAIFSPKVSAIFSPSGKLVLTGSLGNTASIFDVSSGEQQHVLKHTNWIFSAVFSQDGKFALTAGNDYTARIFEVSSGKEIRVLKGHKNWIYSAVFSTDAKFVLTASQDHTARIYEVASGKEVQVLTGHTNYINSAVFSPDGKLALTASEDSTARIFDVSSGKEVQVLKGNAGMITSAVFSPDGKLVLTASHDARIYNVFNEKVLELKGHTGWINSAVFSPDGKFVLTAGEDKTARICDAYSGLEIHVLKGHTGSINSALFSDDGKYAITASVDGTARIYEVSSGKEYQVLGGHTSEINTVVFSPEGKLLLSSSCDNIARICELSSGKQLQVLSGHTGSIASAVFSPDGKLALTASEDSTARIYELSSGKEVQVLKGITGSITSAVFSPNGNLVLTTSADTTARIYDVASGKEVQVIKGHTRQLTSAVFSPDGNFALTCDDNDAHIYEASSGNLVQVVEGSITSAVFSPNGKLLLTRSFSSDPAVIYEISSGKKIKDLKGHTDWVTFADFSPDGKLALTASWDRTARIYDVASGKLKKVLKGHENVINSAVFSPDGNHILTAGADHKTILWETATGKPLYTRLQLKDNDWLVYDEHYRFDGTPGAIEKLYFTCGLEVIDLAQMKDSLWVPGLVEKIMSGQDILINDKLAPKLSDLNICDLTPVIEPIEQENKKILKYRITPRNSGLGNTEVYINGNLTYTLKPQQLQKVKEDKKEVYYLTLSTDTLQQYLTGKKNDENPIVVKSKVKGSGIYGRGVELEIAKTNDDEKPQFYGVFIGVNEYGNPQKTANETRYRNLDYAAKDANDLSLAVEKTAGNLFESDSHIYRLTGTGNEAPTKENLQRVLAEIGEKSKASDILYIFFAGHGDIRKGKNEEGQEQDQIRFMLMNADKANPFTTSFGVEELTKWCSPQKIKAQKRVFVFDACHSGKIIDQTMAFNGRGDDEGARIRQLDKLKDKNGMMILAAAADDESAYEDETLNQGVLTYHLLQVMKEHNDTLLVVRNWFDETIDLVKDYSKANGNKQEPSSFGDGRFEIGNVNQDVREAIKITCPKTRVGSCMFSANSNTKQQYPNVQKRVNEYFSSNGRGDNLVFSKNAEKAYHAQGLYLLIKDEMQITFDLYRGEEVVKEGVELPIKNYKSEDEVVLAITNSIAQEIEKLRLQDDPCKFNH